MGGLIKVLGWVAWITLSAAIGVGFVQLIRKTDRVIRELQAVDARAAAQAAAVTVPARFLVRDHSKLADYHDAYLVQDGLHGPCLLVVQYTLPTHGVAVTSQPWPCTGIVAPLEKDR